MAIIRGDQESTNTSSNDNWKSDAFLNISVPTKSGKMKKLGAIGLKISNPLHKQVIDYLEGSKDEDELADRIIAMFSKSVVDFQTVDKDDNELDLG